MSIAIWFWIIFVLGVLFAGYNGYRDRASIPNSVWVIVLLFLIGLQVFGSPIK